MTRTTLRICGFIALFLLSLPTSSFADETRVPVSAPIDTDSAGKGGDTAINAVVRLICQEKNTSGTGFLHKSGNIITADHVVRDCKNPEFVLPNGALSPASTIASDQDHDLAMLKPSVPLSAKPLSLAPKTDFKVGSQVSTWGYPGGYYGLSPLLSVGYLSGIDAIQKPSGLIVRQWIVNAAFNGGNSGGWKCQEQNMNLRRSPRGRRSHERGVGGFGGHQQFADQRRPAREEFGETAFSARHRSGSALCVLRDARCAGSSG